MDDLEMEVSELSDRKSDLKRDREFMSSSFYIEKEARNKLNLVLPGEEIYVYPDDKNARNVLPEFSDKLGSKDSVEEKSNVRLWTELFF